MKAAIIKAIDEKKFIDISLMNNELSREQIKYFMLNSKEFGFYHCNNCDYYVKKYCYNEMTGFCYQCEDDILKEANGEYDDIIFGVEYKEVRG